MVCLNTPRRASSRAVTEAVMVSRAKESDNYNIETENFRLNIKLLVLPLMAVVTLLVPAGLADEVGG